MRRIISAVYLAALLGFTVGGFAHEGHRHNAMGTIHAIDDDQITLSIGKDERLEFSMTKQTAFVRGDDAAPKDEVAIGERAVVIYEKKEGVNVAIEVKLAPNEQ